MTVAAENSVTISEMIDALPDTVVWVQPVFETRAGEQTQMTALKVQFANAAAHQLMELIRYPVTQCTSINEYIQNIISTPTVFMQYKQVYETGKPQELNYYNAEMNRHFYVLRKKVGDGILAIHRDRTKEENAEREQNIKTEFVQSMLNASLHGVILMKPVYNNGDNIYDFDILAANVAAARHLDKEPDAMVNKMMSNILSRYKEMGFFDTYISALQTGHVQRRELYYEDEKLKAWYDIGVAPVNGSIVLSFENITETKKAKSLVEEAAAYLQTIIDIAQTGIFLFTPVYNDADEVVDFRFRIANRMLAAYVGQEPSKVEGALGSEWFPAYQTNGLFHNYKDTFITGKTNRFDFHYNADDIDVWLDIMSTKLGDEVLVTFSDYTPMKRLQQQLETSVKELKRSNDRLSEFAYVASHDLQEPLRKITTFSNLLAQRNAAALGEDGNKLIERMQNAAERMKTLISDLLNFSQMNNMALNVRQLDLNEVVQGVVSDLDDAVQESNAVIKTKLLPTINGDKIQLQQLFQNLISNAIKFKREDVNPVITITSKLVKAEETEIPANHNHDSRLYYEIVVADNGIGFNQQYAEQIFQIFQRLHGRSDYPGTGIGLAIVQKVVQNHDGYIYAESEPGVGTEFHVLLPEN